MARSRLRTPASLGVAVNQPIQRPMGQLHPFPSGRWPTAVWAKGAGGLSRIFPRGYSWKAHDIHAVQQGARNGIQRVGRGDEQHAGKVERQIDIMVLEGHVLLRVQRFQQRGAGRRGNRLPFLSTSSKSKGVRTFGRDNGADNFAGHGANIGAAVAANFGLVTHAAQRHARIFAPQAGGNAARNGRFAHARRGPPRQIICPFTSGASFARPTSPKCAPFTFFSGYSALYPKASCAL